MKFLIPLLLINVACGGSSQLATSICESYASCELDCPDDDEHCTLESTWEKKECLFEFGFENDLSKHADCSSEYHEALLCLKEESFCDGGDFDFNSDNCEKEIAEVNNCWDKHSSTHNDSSTDTGNWVGTDTGTPG
jgi:hypothetical protein